MKRPLTCIVVLLFFVLVIPVSVFVQAEEVYTYNGAPVVLYRTSSDLRYNYDNVLDDSIYMNSSDSINVGASQWNTEYSSAVHSSFTYSNVDFASMSKQAWNTYYGMYDMAIAYTQLYSGSTWLRDAETAYNSNRQVTMAQIYFSPYHEELSHASSPTIVQTRTKIVTHEMGHSFCFGHTSNTDSIMYVEPSAVNIRDYSLKEYDYNMLQQKYG